MRARAGCPTLSGGVPPRALGGRAGVPAVLDDRRQVAMMHRCLTLAGGGPPRALGGRAGYRRCWMLVARWPRCTLISYIHARGSCVRIGTCFSSRTWDNRQGLRMSLCQERRAMSEKTQTIQYGMFIMPFHPPSKPMAQCYDEDLELIVRAEELGFSEFWIGEHHTMKYENIVMPEIFIGRALGETKTIRLGPAPACLNQHHPAHVASRLAFLDHLSKGRLNLCFGAGSVTADQELYGADPKNAPAMVEEALDMILKLWASDPPYHIDGKFWKIHLEKTVDEETGIGYIHKPLQKPHPPIALPGMSRGSPTMKLAGARGYSPFAHCLVTANVLADLWKNYAEGAHAAGREPKRSDYKIARA